MIGSSQGGIQSGVRPPNYISDQATESSVNNVLARGYQAADRRYQTKQLDKPGFSRGKAAQYIAGQQSVQEMGKAAAEAAGVRSQDQLQNAQMKADYERAREQQAQSMGMSQHKMNMAHLSGETARQINDWNTSFAQQQAALQLMMSLMR